MGNDHFATLGSPRKFRAVENPVVRIPDYETMSPQLGGAVVIIHIRKFNVRVRQEDPEPCAVRGVHVGSAPGPGQASIPNPEKPAASRVISEPP